MAVIEANTELAIDLETAGALLTPEEFDAIEEYDKCYTYELVRGVLVVSPIPNPEVTAPNQLLGHLLWDFQKCHPNGGFLDETLSQQYVNVPFGRRIADRLIWIGLGRVPNVRTDPGSIAVEFVSAGRRNRRRDYVEKREEYGQAGIREYWIFDRFRRTLTVVEYSGPQPTDKVIPESSTYESPLLLGFVVPLDRILRAADRYAEA